MQALMQSGDVVTQIVSTLREDGSNWESSSEGITAIGLLASWGPHTGGPLVAAGAARECVLAAGRALFAQALVAGDSPSRCAQARRCAAVLLPTLLRLAKGDALGCVAQFSESSVARALVYMLRAVTWLPIEGAPQAAAAAQAGAAAPVAEALTLNAADVDGVGESELVEGDGDGEGEGDAAANWAGVSMYRLDLDARKLVHALARGSGPGEAASTPGGADAAAASTEGASSGSAGDATAPDAAEAAGAGGGSGSGHLRAAIPPFATAARRWDFTHGVRDVPAHMAGLVQALMEAGVGRPIASALRALKPGPSRSWRATHGMLEAAITLMRHRPDFAASLVQAGVEERALAVLQSLRMVGLRRDGSRPEVKPAAVVQALAAKAGGAEAQDVIGLQTASALRKARTTIRTDPPAVLLMDVAHLAVEVAIAAETPRAPAASAAPVSGSGPSVAYGGGGGSGDAGDAAGSRGPRGSRQLQALLRAATGSSSGPLHAPWLPFRIANVFAQPTGVHGHVAVALLRVLHMLAARGDVVTRKNALMIYRNTTAPASATVSRKYYIPLPEASIPLGDLNRSRQESRRTGAPVARAPLPDEDLDLEAAGVQLFATNDADLALTLASKGKWKGMSSSGDKGKATAEGEVAESAAAAGEGAGAGAGAGGQARRNRYLFNNRDGPLAVGLPPARPLLNMLQALSATDAKAAAQRRRLAAETVADRLAGSSAVLAADNSVAAVDSLTGFGLGAGLEAGAGADASMPLPATSSAADAASDAASSGSAPAAPLA